MQENISPENDGRPKDDAGRSGDTGPTKGQPPFVDYLNAQGENQAAYSENPAEMTVDSSEVSISLEPAPTPADAPVPPRSAGRSAVPLFWVFGFLLAVLLGVSLVERVSYSIGRGQQRAALETLENSQLASFAQASKLVAEGVGRSVVYIEALGSGGGSELNALLGVSQPQTMPTGQGSGVIVDEEGYILTNHHVISGAEELRVHLREGAPKVAKVVGYDPLTDLAVLKIEADGLLALQWGDSDSLEAGEPVWAVGSPFGLDNSITMGIVSAKGRRGIGGRNGKRYQNYLQTDAAVNPGNSGGALVNIRGELVGINTAIVGMTYQGISFAIPSSMAREVYDRLRANNGKFNRGWLGVRLERVAKPTEKGALINETVPDSPAEKAGLVAGDRIVKWGEHVVEDQEDLLWQVAATTPGSAVAVTVVRDGERETLSVTVVDWPAHLQP